MKTLVTLETPANRSHRIVMGYGCSVINAGKSNTHPGEFCIEMKTVKKQDDLRNAIQTLEQRRS